MFHLSSFYVVLFLCVLCTFHIPHSGQGIDTGFWYDNTRPPETLYDTLPYANLSMRLMRSYHDGPGRSLLEDPFDFMNSLFAGNTIARQAFDAQFIFDMSLCLNLTIDRIFVLKVSKGAVHFSWESTSVIVNFAILERNQTGLNTLGGDTLLDVTAKLTNMVQIPDSSLYTSTNITKYTDPLFGIVVEGWDISLQLTFAIETIGGEAVVDGYYINQGRSPVSVPSLSYYHTCCHNDHTDTTASVSSFQPYTTHCSILSLPPTISLHIYLSPMSLLSNSRYVWPMRHSGGVQLLPILRMGALLRRRCLS